MEIMKAQAALLAGTIYEGPYDNLEWLQTVLNEALSSAWKAGHNAGWCDKEEDF